MPSSGDCTRVRVEHGTYRQTNGKYAVGVMVGRRPALSHPRGRHPPRSPQAARSACRLRGRCSRSTHLCAEHGRVQLVRDPPRGRSPTDCCTRERAQLSPAPSRAGLLVLCAESDCAPLPRRDVHLPLLIVVPDCAASGWLADSWPPAHHRRRARGEEEGSRHVGPNTCNAATRYPPAGRAGCWRRSEAELRRAPQGGPDVLLRAGIGTGASSQRALG